MGTGIKRVQAVLVVLMLTILGFLGAQPAIATQTEPGPGTGSEQPTDPGEPTGPVIVPPDVLPPVIVQPTQEPVPTLPPQEPEITPAPVQPPADPAPVVPPVVEPVAPPAVAPADPGVPATVGVLPASPAEVGTNGYAVQPEVPEEATTSAPAAPTPTPVPSTTKTAAPPVASAEITGPLKAALAPVAENNPLVQGLTVLVLILLGVAYFRALRSTRIRGPRVNGK